MGDHEFGFVEDPLNGVVIAVAPPDTEPYSTGHTRPPFDPADPDADYSPGDHWTPSLSRPLHSIRCEATTMSGDRCRAWAILGMRRCRSHMRMSSQRAKLLREEALDNARLNLTQMVPFATDTIFSLLDPETPESVRLKAATEILDRAGLRGGIEIDVTGEIQVSPSDELRNRLSKIQQRINAEPLPYTPQPTPVELHVPDQMAFDFDTDIIDAEVVEA